MADRAIGGFFSASGGEEGGEAGAPVAARVLDPAVAEPRDALLLWRGRRRLIILAFLTLTSLFSHLRLSLIASVMPIVQCQGCADQ